MSGGGIAAGLGAAVAAGLLVGGPATNDVDEPWRALLTVSAAIAATAIVAFVWWLRSK